MRNNLLNIFTKTVQYPRCTPIHFISSKQTYVHHDIPIRSIHRTSILPQAVRRRRRGGNGNAAVTSSSSITSPPRQNDAPTEAPELSLAPKRVNDPIEFGASAEILFDRLEEALEPMKLCNEVFDVVRESREDGAGGTLRIILRPVDGNYTFDFDETCLTMNLQSPISGMREYVLCAETGEWLGAEDGHSLEGLLVRDLIRQCNGYPAL
mmetsp:Transcript_53341/g.64278  ORF Transcript_53341/g.64278 Transcript_53341/m.64278 type:complete len:209 (-) Transcript_53341:174-800(-)|eukprot:CAMPEP_0172515246 /NCGR_PEP_ID=MMETSP1066-20121228/266491_1 /TAXON_ID=671091 /ORGANISM="Coscinodiscus wailesii, Strain CCMP2513" /LENGTH=208 /DNA_ID=CAMNT_0013296251 /DNA_START=89 /DNA_END=715 /DNA_ORIENTATION=+